VRTRKRCQLRGHKFRELEGVPLPVLFCRRWRCEAETVAPWVHGELRTALNLIIERHAR